MIALPSRRLLGTALAATQIASCGVFGPDREPPQMSLPAHYTAAAPEPNTDARPSEGAGAADNTAPARAIADWWTVYGSATLDAWVDEGLRASPSLGAARHHLDAARELLRGQVGSSLLPSVDVGFDPSRQRALSLPGLPQQTFLYNVFAAEIKTSYSFDFFGAAVLADRALAGQVRQQSYEWEASRRALAANIVVAAIDAASLREQLAATEELVAIAERRAAQTAARFRLGSAPRTEMLAADEDAATVAASLPSLRAELLAVRHTQALLMGRTPDGAPEPLALDALELPARVPVSVPSDLLHQRPDILAAEAAVRASADKAGAAAASMFPTLSLSAAYGRGGFDWSTFTSPAGAIWSVGGSLTQPLLHGGALRARKRQYEAEYAAAVDDYRQTVLAAFKNVADTLVALESDAAALAQYQRAAEAAEAFDRDTAARYRLGATPLNLSLAARQQFRSMRVQYLRARAARLADSAALFDAMGTAPNRIATGRTAASDRPSH
jgi:NodT family efflux transporter outer membrane factor (OMF) lipoprotein